MLKHRVKSGGYYCQNCQSKQSICALSLDAGQSGRSEWQLGAEFVSRDEGSLLSNAIVTS
jgi:hypothetical protein